MADCIDREAVLDYIRYKVCQGEGNIEHRCQRGSCAYCGICEIMCDISSMPAADVQPKATCRMIPLEPDCRGYTDVFICTHCHQHIHLGFIRKEYSGNFCIECGAELKETETQKGKF